MGTMGVVGSAGSQSPSAISRTIERIFDDSQHTGQINLSGRKLRKYPTTSKKYDLLDITLADLSKNRFSEVPEEVCDYVSVEILNFYHNNIKRLPQAITRLTDLIHLNLSRNQLSSIPHFISDLQDLKILLISNNKLTSLPDEITNLKHLMELDVSCNRLTQLPGQMCNMSSLRSLSLRRNLLIQLPFGLTQLKLRQIDIAFNRIAHLPPDFHKMNSLEELHLDNNPLQTLPPCVYTRGLVHIMKYLEDEARRSETSGSSSSHDKAIFRNGIRRWSFSLSMTSDGSGHWWHTIGREKHKQKTIDSGYSTAEGSEKSRWSSAEVSPLSPEELVPVVLKGTEAEMKRKNLKEEPKDERNSVQDNIAAKEMIAKHINKLKSDSPYDAISRELERQKADYAAKKKKAEQLKLKLMENDKKRNSRHESIERESQRCRPTSNNFCTNEMATNDGFVRLRHFSNNSTFDHDRRQKRNDENQESNGFVNGFISSRVDDKKRNISNADVSKSSFSRSSLRVLASSSSSLSPVASTESRHEESEVSFSTEFTRLEMETEMKKDETKELRKIIETRLKLVLPDDVEEALQDGVILCHLANHLRPRSITCIHIPSPAVPKLSQAKCRRNVDNFLLACRRTGLDQSRICSSSVILEKKGIVGITEMVRVMIENSSKPRQSTI